MLCFILALPLVDRVVIRGADRDHRLGEQDHRFVGLVTERHPTLAFEAPERAWPAPHDVNSAKNLPTTAGIFLTDAEHPGECRTLIFSRPVAAGHSGMVRRPNAMTDGTGHPTGNACPRVTTVDCPATAIGSAVPTPLVPSGLYSGL